MAGKLAGLRIVVTGGAGFIGSHLTERLLAEDPASVFVLDDLSTGSRDNLAGTVRDVTLHEGDVCDPAVARIAADADLVFHLAVRNVRASIRDPQENFRVNADGTLALLEEMRLGSRGRFVYVSSSEVYGSPADGRFTEGTVPAPTTVYGAGKLAGELVTQVYHRTYGIDTRVIRPFNNYGPRSHFEGDSGEVVPKFILRALANRPLTVHGDGTQTRDFMYVRDTARWLIDLGGVDALAGDVVNIGSGQEVRIADLAEMIISATGSASRIEFTGPRPGDLPRLRADTSKVESLASFGLDTTLAEGLKATIEYFAEQDVDALLTREVERNWT